MKRYLYKSSPLPYPFFRHTPSIWCIPYQFSTSSPRWSLPSFSNELNICSSTRPALMLLNFSLSISLSFRILSKKIDNRIFLYRLNRLPIMIISNDIVGDLFLISIVSSLILCIKKGSIGNLLLLPLSDFIKLFRFYKLGVIYDYKYWIFLS